MSFDKHGDIQWRPVKALIKHKVISNGFKRIRTGGGELRVSPAHSLFRSNSSHIKPVMAQELECARPNETLNGKNHILAVHKLKQNILGSNTSLDLFDLIEELPEKIRQRIFIQAKDVPAIKEKISNLYGSIKEFLYKNGRTDKSTVYTGFKKNVVPFQTYMQYSDEYRDDAKIYIKPYNEHLYDRHLQGEKLENFVKLVAWFITEGKAVHSGIVISQRKSNNKEILDVAKALGITMSISETKGFSNKHQRKTETIISNMKMSGLYTYILPYLAGATSREKTIPSFIFDLNAEYRTIFLKTLFKGDGYHDLKSRRISYSSMSDKLLTGISMLAVSNGWRVRVIPKSKGRAGTLLLYQHPRKQLDITIKETAGVPVYEIQDYKNGWNWEYDISVDVKDGEENFVGGTGLVFYHNSPFTNVTLDLAIPSYMEEEPAIIGGDLKDENYSDFTDEVHMINKAFAEVMLEGDAKGRPMTFPIPTYNITKDFEWDNEKLDQVWEMTAKYGIPYFSNFINSDMKPEDARSMCCRLRLSNRELRKRGGGLFGANPKTGSIGVVTINLPQIGYLASDDDDFFERLDRLMDLAKQSLIIKREIIENLTLSGLHPYSKFYLSDVKETFGEYWKNHFSTIGLIGMNDALLNFMDTDIGSKEGKTFAEKVLDHMRDKMADFQEETGDIFNLEATPAEGSLAPDEKVLLSQSDPRLSEIGPLIDTYLENNIEGIQKVGSSEILKLAYGKMFTYGFSRKTQKMKKYPVTALVRHPGKSMYEITTSSGRKVKVTGQHSVFTLDSEGIPKEVMVHNLDVGAPIAVPKQIEMEGIHEEFNLIELFKNAPFNNNLYCIVPPYFIEELLVNSDVKRWATRYYAYPWKDIKHNWRKRRVIPLQLLYDLTIEMDRKVLLSSKIFYRHTKNTKPMNVIIPINEEFGFIIGSLLAEGWLNERSEFNNTNKKFATAFLHSVEKIFGKDVAKLSSRSRRKPRKTSYRVYLSKSIGLFFRAISLQGKSAKKNIPSFLFSSSLDCAAGLVKGFYLGDGSFYENQSKNDYSIRLYTNSQELAEGLNILLLRFGILTKLRQEDRSKQNPRWNNNYIVSITGVDNLEKFFQKILKKRYNICNNIHSGRECIPVVPLLLKQIMQRHNITPGDINIHKDSFNKNVRLNRMSIQYFREIVQKLSDTIPGYDETLEKLKLMADSDIYWDSIKSIKNLKSTQYVYDFEVDVKDDLVNNFLGGSGLICLHNTSYRLARLDKKQFPDIRTYNQEFYGNGGKVEPYYTNSTQLPVGYTSDVFEALDLQDSLQTKYTGGTVFHIFLGEEEPSVTATKKLIRKVAQTYSLPYYTITPTFSICPKHGYLPGKHRYCPKCDEEIGYKGGA
jgi:ribonucleoside-triphosphate reductase